MAIEPEIGLNTGLFALSVVVISLSNSGCDISIEVRIDRTVSNLKQLGRKPNVKGVKR